jgi:alpha-methylacyl-CoA racemase
LIIRARVIYCSLTGYGQTGPYADRAGHDINYAALSGLAAMTGTHSDGPVLHGNPVCDLAGSYHALIGLLMALYHRERTGEGQAVDISMTDGSLMMSGLWMSMGLGAGQFPGWEDTPLNGGAFYGYYRTADKQFLSVGSLELKFLQGFLEAIDALHLLRGDPRDLRVGIQDRLQTRTLAEWLEVFQHLDVCVEPVLGLDQIPLHPQFQARGMFVDVPVQEGGVQKQLGSPLKFSSFRPLYRFIGRSKGADTERLV